MIVSRMFVSSDDATEAAIELVSAGFRSPAIHVIDQASDDSSEAAIMKYGVQEPRAKAYAEGVAAGKALVVVEAPPGASGKAADILQRARAGDDAEVEAAFEAMTREEPKPADWTDATPLSRALGWRVLLDDPTPFSTWIGKKVLSDNPTPLSNWLGRSVLSHNPAPLSSWLGWKMLSDSPAPLSAWLGRPVLSNDPTPLSSAIGKQVLSDNPTPLSTKLNRKVLSDDPTPLSRWLNMPVLSGARSDR